MNAPVVPAEDTETRRGNTCIRTRQQHAPYTRTVHHTTPHHTTQYSIHTAQASPLLVLIRTTVFLVNLCRGRRVTDDLEHPPVMPRRDTTVGGEAQVKIVRLPYLIHHLKQLKHHRVLAEVVACLEHDDDVVRALFPVLEHEPQRYLGEDREVTFALERGMNTQQHTVQHTAQHTVQHTVQHTRRAGFPLLSSSLLFSPLLSSSQRTLALLMTRHFSTMRAPTSTRGSMGS